MTTRKSRRETNERNQKVSIEIPESKSLRNQDSQESKKGRKVKASKSGLDK